MHYNYIQNMLDFKEKPASVSSDSRRYKTFHPVRRKTMTNLPTIMRTSSVPFRSIDSVFDNLFNDFFNSVSRTPFNTVSQKSNYPRVDIRETREAVTLDATVPGLNKEDVSIDFEDGYLKLSADRQDANADDFIHREIHRSSFSRWFSVDEETYDIEKINASLDNGILSITIPKKEEAVKPLARKIEVKSKQGAPC